MGLVHLHQPLNSYLLSGELMTKLTGRYIESRCRTLTFKDTRT